MSSLFDDLREGLEEAIAFEQGKGEAEEDTISDASFYNPVNFFSNLTDINNETL